MIATLSPAVQAATRLSLPRWQNATTPGVLSARAAARYTPKGK